MLPETTPWREEHVLDLAAGVRQAVSAEISLANPLPEPIEFEVLLTGEGLLGDSTFTLAPLAVGTYELYYSPLVAKGHSGSIAFLNDRVGEFWYRLKLKASPASPVQLEPLACAVGAKATCPITIENPLGKEISLQAHVTNRTNFVVDPPSVTLPPYGDATVLVEYVPSSIGEDEHTQITLTNPNLGDWQYLATGRGEPPAIMPEHCPVATVAEASSYMFSFRNPFPMPLVLDVTLRNTKVDATSAAAAVPELATAGSSRGSRRGSSRGSERSRKSEPVEPAEPDAFTLLLRKTSGVVLSPFTSMSVPLSFAPVSTQSNGRSGRSVNEHQPGKSAHLVLVRACAPAARSSVVASNVCSSSSAPARDSSAMPSTRTVALYSHASATRSAALSQPCCRCHAAWSRRSSAQSTRSARAVASVARATPAGGTASGALPASETLAISPRNSPFAVVVVTVHVMRSTVTGWRAGAWPPTRNEPTTRKSIAPSSCARSAREITRGELWQGRRAREGRGPGGQLGRSRRAPDQARAPPRAGRRRRAKARAAATVRESQTVARRRARAPPPRLPPP